MKQEKQQKYAFSLAEALITLLIVCLITLASIPVLTKKKRTVTDGGSGQWICTLAAQKDANGNITGYKHVYWNSQTSGGDINDPSTWDVAGDGTSCTFAPPLKAKNFAVTLIGGGGGGADGISEKKIYMDNANTSFSPEEDGEYRLAVIGAGGGGCGSDDGGGCDWAGGGGGAGGYFVGTIELKKGLNYTSVIGNPRAGVVDNIKYKASTYRSCMDSDMPDCYGNSQFKVNGNNLIIAGAGQDGGGTGKGVKTWGGYAGAGGNVVYSSLLSSYKYTEQWKGSGQAGGPGGRTPTYIGGGGGFYIPAPFYGASNSATYGTGGNGNIKCNPNGAQGNAGTGGTVQLWQILQMPGKGGNASPLESYVLANIKGKLVAKIGQGGNPNEDGKQTTADIYDSQGNVTRTLKSSYGTKGIKGENVAQNTGTDTKYVYGETGANSFWVNKGGGTAGKCEDEHYEKYWEKYTDYESKSVSIGLHWEIGAVSQGRAPALTDSVQRCPQIEGQKTYCIGYVVPLSLAMLNNSIRHDQLEQYADNFREAYTKLTSENYNSVAAFESALSQLGLKNIDYWYPNTSKSLFDNYKEPNGEPEVLGEITEQVPVEKEKLSSRHVPAQCTKAGDGTYYGAGGGGGGTSTQIGMSGKGGKGAPGAVIIEW